MSDGAVLSNVQAPRPTLPSCPYTAAPKRWAQEVQMPAGQEWGTIPLSAHLICKRVTIAVSSANDVWRDREMASFCVGQDR